MGNETAVPSLSEAYRKAWRSCARLWILFLIRLVATILNFGALFLCLLLAFSPFVKYLLEHLEELEDRNFTKLIQNFDFGPYFHDPAWLWMMGGVAFLYVTWWSLIEAFLGGAFYARFREFQKNGAAFSWRQFLRDGIRYMFPMLGLQVAWMTLFLAFLAVLFITVFLGVLLLKLVGVPHWVSILLFGVPIGLLTVFSVLVTVGLAPLAGAFLVDGNGVVASLRKAFERCVENRGRVVWGFVGVCLIYFIISTGPSLVLSLLSYIPFIGGFFALTKFLLSTLLSVVYSVYGSSLAVTFLLERESAA